ncbi:dUTP pyrophosphatase [Neorhizobium galegae]|uniref:dUTP diphosphatase n=1 Tax=Neorhizobium galegae TaxID=399 RepID=UPI001AE50F3F|nr:dUTP pyrophosphatase [Neorhizobium galegae]
MSDTRPDPNADPGISRSGPMLNLVRLAHGEGLELPAYETAGAAGMDIRAAVSDPMTLAPGARALVPTGFIFEIPHGFEMQVRPRSGLAFKHGVTCLNTPGTIDSDYRGEVKVLLINLGDADFIIERGMRVAQLVIAPVVQAGVTETDTTSETARGAGGFGSTGV